MQNQTPIPRFAIAADGLQISIYQNGYPREISAHLERLYKNIFSSLSKFRADGQLEFADCYIADRNGIVETALLYIRQLGTIEVLNSAIALSKRELDVFAKTVFSLYPDARRIRFEAIQCGPGKITRPYQQHDCLEDIVLALPESASAYFKRLGKREQSSLKRQQKRLLTEVDGFRWDCYEKEAISDEHVNAIIALSSARISSKQGIPSHTNTKTMRLKNLLKAAGSALVATVDGKVCGGVLCTAHGGNIFMHVVAHDLAYNAYSLGKVCILRSIEAAIEQGAGEYHFLWGKYEYKFRFLGLQRDYDRVIIYRSFLAMAMSPRLFFTVALRGYGRRARQIIGLFR